MTTKNRDLHSLKSYLENHSSFRDWLSFIHIDSFFQHKPDLIIQALTHSSFVHEHKDWEQGHNERLEFLGDAVLDHCLSRLLFQTFPDLAEGELSRLRSSLVNEEHLHQWACLLGLPSHLMLGKGEAQKDEVEKAIVADALEALIGALSLIDESAPFQCLKRWIDLFDQTQPLAFLSLKRLDLFDPKSRLQEITLEKSGETPEYDSLSLGEGKGFESTVVFQGKVFEKGRGSSKKKAEIAAARETLVKHFISK